MTLDPRYLKRVAGAADLTDADVRAVTAWALGSIDPPAVAELDEHQCQRVAMWLDDVRRERVDIDTLRFGVTFARALDDHDIDRAIGRAMVAMATDGDTLTPLRLRPERRDRLREIFASYRAGRLTATIDHRGELVLIEAKERAA